MHKAINFIKSLFSTVKVQVLAHKRASVLVLLVLIVAVGFLLKDGAVEDKAIVVTKPTVETSSVSKLASGRNVTAVGTVEAINEARLVTEAGGRITGVFAKIGDYVNAGTILATVENRNEQAALLQAEGAYEAAEAASAQGEIGTVEAGIRLNEAKQEFSRASNATYGTVLDVLISSVDQFYANGTGPYPSLRITTRESTAYLSKERLDLQSAMTVWSAVDLTGATVETSYKHSDFVKQQITKALALVDILKNAVNDDINKTRYTDDEKANYNSILTGVRAELVAALNTIESARLGLESAVENEKRAEIAATGSVTSASSAQKKQALGIYRAAQANYEKTLVRTPISGVVNAFYLKTGDYVSPSTPAVIVANNSGLEIKTAVAEADAQKLKIGDQVNIEKTATGTITAMGGAIDPTSGKVAVTIGITDANEVRNGQTVTIKFLLENETTTGEVSLPLAAIKMTGSGPVVFTISNDNKLSALPLVLGPVNGETVIVLEGLDNETEIVVDARGLKEGQEVIKLTN